MKRGFTLLEVMLASSISVIVLAAVSGLYFSVWMLAKESSDELQGALRARAVRERLFYQVTNAVDRFDVAGGALATNRVYGLFNATNVISGPEEILVYYATNANAVLNLPESLLCFTRAADPVSHRDFDGLSIESHEPASDYRDPSDVLQFVYLAVRPSARAVYHDRLVVTPSLGPEVTSREIEECFGAP